MYALILNHDYMVKLTQYKNTDLGLFLVRLGIGLVFIIHGWMKLSDAGFEFLCRHASCRRVLGVSGSMGQFWAVCRCSLGCGHTGRGDFGNQYGVAIVLIKVEGFAGGYEFDYFSCLHLLSTVGQGNTADRCCRKG